MKQSKLNKATHDYLIEIVEARNKTNPAMKWTIQGVIADLVIKAHKRETRA